MSRRSQHKSRRSQHKTYIPENFLCINNVLTTINSPNPMNSHEVQISPSFTLLSHDKAANDDNPRFNRIYG